MKTSNIMKSALALALGLCASGVLAQPTTPVSEDFEGAAFANGINGASTNNLTWAAGSGDASAIATKNGDKVLELDTGDAVVSATIASASEIAASASAGQTTTFAANVSFTPATSIPEISDNSGDLKFALFAKVEGANTNLCIVSAEGTNTASNITIADSTEKAVLVTFKPDYKFEVAIAGTKAEVNSVSVFTFRNAAAFSKVEFQGNGTVDDLTFVADVPAVVNVTVTGGANATAVWTVNEATLAEAPATLTEGDTYSVTYTANAGYKFADGAATSASGTAGTKAISINIADAVADSPTYNKDEALIIGGEGGTTHELTQTEAEYLNAMADGKTPTEMGNILAGVNEDTFEKAALLNQDITKANAGSYQFNITKIRKSGTTVYVTVSLTRSGTVLGNIRGTAALYTCDTPNGTYTKQASVDISEAELSSLGTTTKDFTGVTDKFFKVVIE